MTIEILDFDDKVNKSKTIQGIQKMTAGEKKTVKNRTKALQLARKYYDDKKITQKSATEEFKSSFDK